MAILTKAEIVKHGNEEFGLPQAIRAVRRCLSDRAEVGHYPPDVLENAAEGMIILREAIPSMFDTIDAIRAALEAWVRAMTIPYDHENSEDGRLDIAIELTKAAGVEWPE